MRFPGTFSIIVLCTCSIAGRAATVQFFGSTATIGGVTFDSTAVPPHPAGLTVVGKNATYAASHFYSAFLGEGDGNRHHLQPYVESRDYLGIVQGRILVVGRVRARALLALAGASTILAGRRV